MDHRSLRKRSSTGHRVAPTGFGSSRVLMNIEHERRDDWQHKATPLLAACVAIDSHFDASRMWKSECLLGTMTPPRTTGIAHRARDEDRRAAPTRRHESRDRDDPASQHATRTRYVDGLVPWYLVFARDGGGLERSTLTGYTGSAAGRCRAARRVSVLDRRSRQQISAQLKSSMFPPRSMSNNP